MLEYLSYRFLLLSMLDTNRKVFDNDIYCYGLKPSTQSRSESRSKNHHLSKIKIPPYYIFSICPNIINTCMNKPSDPSPRSWFKSN